MALKMAKAAERIAYRTESDDALVMNDQGKLFPMLPGTKGLNVAKAGTLREPANRFLILLMPIFFFFFFLHGNRNETNQTENL